MIQKLQFFIKLLFGIAALLSSILLIYCIYSKKEVSTWQFPVMLALFLDSILIFTILKPNNKHNNTHNHENLEKDSTQKILHKRY